MFDVLRLLVAAIMSAVGVGGRWRCAGDRGILPTGIHHDNAAAGKCRPRNSSPSGAPTVARNRPALRNGFSTCAVLVETSARRGRLTRARSGTPSSGRCGRPSGRLGRADVYKQGYFAWEFKGLHRDLDVAYRQLLRYREALNNPPLLVVSDFQTPSVVHTNFHQQSAGVVHTITPGRPARTGMAGTYCATGLSRTGDALEPDISAATTLHEATANILRRHRPVNAPVRGVDSLEVAQFLNRLVFCFFAPRTWGCCLSRVAHATLRKLPQPIPVRV